MSCNEEKVTFTLSQSSAGPPVRNVVFSQREHIVQMACKFVSSFALVHTPRPLGLSSFFLPSLLYKTLAIWTCGVCTVPQVTGNQKPVGAEPGFLPKKVLLPRCCLGLFPDFILGFFTHPRTGLANAARQTREEGAWHKVRLLLQHHLSQKDKCENIKTVWSWGGVTGITKLGGLSPWLSVELLDPDKVEAWGRVECERTRLLCALLGCLKGLLGRYHPHPLSR